ncbi:conserved hypothetical protein [Virus Rctr71]|nr:conserved hypothetical protein [Virus Rctr71]
MAQARGCGYRNPGSLYCESRLVDGGSPIEAFLMDPPVAYSQQSIGIQMYQDAGDIWHILDVIGKENYPYPSDFIEEGRHMGFSRRLPKNIDVSKLTRESHILCIHERALLKTKGTGLILRGGVYELENESVTDIDCFRPKTMRLCQRYLVAGDDSHFEKGRTCSRHLWVADNTGDCRTFNGFQYETYALEIYEEEPVFEMAIFLTLPITNLTVIKADDGSHTELLNKVRASTELNVEEEES